ncbi:MAG: hypothetical protein E7461_07800 [Ruminococcaceae bacterium]|nr:hypothetical protein [Oscillospiraceae bacterium]
MKRTCAIIFSFILLLFLSACTTDVPNSPQPTEPPVTTAPSDPSEPATLTQADLQAIEDFLNDVENNGFVGSNCYTSPSEIELLWVFYDGAGIAVPLSQWSDGEAEAVLAATGWEDFFNYPTKIPAAAANAYLLEKCGTPLSAFNNGTIPGFHYVESYDAYYTMHGDTNRTYITVESGHIDENGHYIIRYAVAYDCPTGDIYTVTLRKTNAGYQFISNVEEYNPDPYPVHEISADKLTIDGTKKTYKGQNITLRVPVDWLALEQHSEDGSAYFFREPTFDRCQLTFYSTGSQYARERTEAEYLELFSSSERTDVKILSYTKETLSGYGCTKVVYSYTDDGIEYIGTRYDNVITGLCLYDFAITYPVAESERFAPVFESIIDSIVLQPY